MRAATNSKQPEAEENIVWVPQPGSQTRFLSCPVFEVLYDGSRGPGKALSVNEIVMTPSGPKPMGDMKVGMYVCCPDGTTSRVIGVYPQGKQLIYKVKFKDRIEVQATADHIWPYRPCGPSGLKADMGQEYRLGLTKQIKKKVDFFKDSGQNVLMPMTSPVSLRFPINPSTRKQMFDPYLLGLLLGDGCLRVNYRIGFTTIDKQLSDYFERFGGKFGSGDDWVIITRDDRFGLIPKLKFFGLWMKYSHEKFIPTVYKYSPEETRLAVLQGLMDTDGTIDKDGCSSYSSASRQLAYDVQFLVQSLGGKATMSIRKTTHRDAYSLYIRMPNSHSLFRLKRKLARCTEYMHSSLLRQVEEISEYRYGEAQCIKIDHPMGLFLTNGCAATHNSDALIMDYARYVGTGFGAAWRGILFRQTYKQLSDIVARTKKWFFQIFPQAKFNESDFVWKFPDGEELLLRYMLNADDYWNYHGHEYPWIGWEELTNWPSPDCYDSMKACCRSSAAGLPRKYRATCNPYGKGHGWVKARFVDPAPPGSLIIDEEGNERVRIQGFLHENKILENVDPEYIKTIKSISDPNKRKAWVEGDWDIVAGGAIDDVWERDVHVIQPFDIPKGWHIDRSFDWGSSKPFSVGWWAESDGTEFMTKNGKVKSYPPGTVFRIAEYYGWNGKANEGCRMLASNIAREIKRIESNFQFYVHPGPADNSIFDADTGVSIADEMGRQGITWTRSNKSPGSRVSGLEKVRELLENSKQHPMENPGMFIFENCTHFIRTVPVLPRDTRKIDDVDTDSEDHVYDETRYRVMKKDTSIRQVQVVAF